MKENEVRECSTHAEINAYKILVGKLKGKRQLVRTRRERIILKLILRNRVEGVDWFHLVVCRIQKGLL
jgi:hypothetical protein